MIQNGCAVCSMMSRRRASSIVRRRSSLWTTSLRFIQPDFTFRHGNSGANAFRSMSTAVKPSESPEKIFYRENDEDDEDDDDDDDLSENHFPLPWKTLLDAPARATWRVADPRLPDSLDEAFQMILKEGNRTPKQLKRAHRKVLEIHNNIAEFRERERRKMVNGKYYRGKDAAEDGEIQPVYYGYDETLATLKHRLIPNFAIVRRVLDEAKSLVDLRPKRIVDFGIGCGSSSAAALDLFRGDIEWIHGIDPSQPMRECSQRLLEETARRDDYANVPRITFSTGLSMDSGGQGSFDLALFSYTATDLPDVTSTLAAAAMLFEKLKPGGVMVMIEPGTPDGFNSIRAVRNMLLDCCPPDDPEFEWKERCHVIAPCTHNGPCPMVRHKKEFNKKHKLAYDVPQDLVNEELDDTDSFQSRSDDFSEDADFVEMTSNPGNLSEFDAFNSSFCSFVQTIPGSDSRKGEKFSYLVVQKRVFGEEVPVESEFGKDDDLTKLLALSQSAVAEQDAKTLESLFYKVKDLEERYLESEEDNLGLELLKSEQKRGGMGRIVRAPIKKKGHVYIDYCAAPGRIIRSRVAKSSSNVAPGMWNAARKSRWGGFWPDTMEKVFHHKK